MKTKQNGRQNRIVRKKIVRWLLIGGVAAFLIGASTLLLGDAKGLENVRDEARTSTAGEDIQTEGGRVKLDRGDAEYSSIEPILSKSDDTTPPEIISVQHTPSSLSQGMWVNITANVADNTAVSVVRINMAHIDFGAGDVAMKRLGDSDVYYINTTFTHSGTYYYFIRANDTSNNQNTSATYTMIISEAKYDVNLTKGNITIVESSAEAPPPLNSSGAYGRIGYWDNYPTPQWHPLKYARVELWDDYGLWALATGHTDANGYYALWASGGDWDGTPYDIRVKIFMDDGKVWVASPVVNICYWIETDTYYNVEGWKEISVDVVGDIHRAAAHIYSTIMEEQVWFKAQTGFERGDIKVEYPVSGETGFKYNPLSRWMNWIEININDGWETDTFQHEYAHAIMYDMYGTWVAEANPNHSLTWETDHYTAFIEGWAEFMECAVDDESLRPAHVALEERKTSYDLEYAGKWSYPGRPAFPDDKFEDTRPGHEGPDDYDTIEGNVAGIFWDIFDTTTSYDMFYPEDPWQAYPPPYDDDDLAMGINEIFDVLINYDPWPTVPLLDNPWTIHQFWDGWFARGHGNTHWMKAIYYNHGIVKMTENAPTVTSLSPSSGAYRGTITLTATGISDADIEDRNYLRVRFEYYYDVNGNGVEDDAGAGSRWTLISESISSSATRSASWVTTSLSDGKYLIRVIVSDDTEEAIITHSIIVDNTKPGTIYSLSPVAPDGNNGWYRTTPFLTVTGIDDTSGIFSVDVEAYNTKTVRMSAAGSSATFSLEILDDGEWTVYCWSEDKAGNVGEKKSFTLKIDRTAPVTTDNAPTTWQPCAISVTLYPADPTSGVYKTYYKKWLSTTTEPTSWTEGTIIDLNADGVWNIKYYSEDNAGNSETPITKQVKIDTTPPSAPGTSTDAGVWAASTTVTFTWTAASDDLSGIASYWLQVGTTPGGSDKFNGEIGNVLSKEITGCVDGSTYYARVKAKNGAGLWGAWSGNSDGITIDVSKPSCSIHSVFETSDYLHVSGTTLYYNPNYASSFTIRVTASDTISGLEKAEGSQAFGDMPIDITPAISNYQFELTYTVESGTTFSGTIIITVYDIAGNTNTCTITVVRDTTPPTIILGIPPIAESSEYLHAVGSTLYYSDLMGSTPQSFTTQGTASDTQAGLYQATASTAFSDAQVTDTTPSSWSWTYTVVSTDNGIWQIVVTVYDNVNNYATATFYCYEDLQGPNAPALTQPTNRATITERRPTFYWSAPTDPGNSGVWCYILQLDTSSSFSNPIEIYTSGTSCQVGNDLEFTTYYWRVKAKDNVGNWGGWSSTWSFTLQKVYGVDLEPENYYIDTSPGSEVVFSITVKNTGNDYDTITITTTAGTLSHTSVRLNYEQSAIIKLKLTASSVPCMETSAVVTGKSQGNPSDDIKCTAHATILSEPPPEPPIKGWIPFPIEGPVIGRDHIGINGYVSRRDGTGIGALPGDGQFCINMIIELIDISRILDLLDFGLPDGLPHPFHSDANTLYQVYYLNVSNPFDTIILVNLSIYGIPEGWNAYLDNYNITLNASEYVMVTLTVVIPKTTTLYRTTIWVLGTIEGYNYLFVYGVNVTVGKLPAAIATFSSFYPVILENDIVTFSATYSYDPDGTVISYEWDFGDGIHGYGETVSHSYESAGKYIITLTVRDNYNFTNSTQIEISVERHSLEINIQSMVTEVIPGETAIYMIKIANTGTIGDTYMLRTGGLNPSWNYPTQMYLSIFAGEALTLYLKITITPDFPLVYDTMYNFTIAVTCVHDQAMMSNAPLAQVITETLSIIATKESKTRYMINETTALLTTLEKMNIQSGVKNSLGVKLQNALSKLNTALSDILSGNEQHANNMLNTAKNQINAFINEVEAQRGKKISEEDADILVNAAQMIILHIDNTVATPL